jgi:hypothetical protein
MMALAQDNMVPVGQQHHCRCIQSLGRVGYQLCFTGLSDEPGSCIRKEALLSAKELVGDGS